MINVSEAWVINLDRRKDRRAVLEAKLAECQWPFPAPQWFRAIEGDKVGVPPEFGQGGGAFGCRQSHVWLLADALMRDVQSILILEDDADIQPDFGERWAAFAALVPDDWEGILLGGQHHAPPNKIGQGIVRVVFSQRTHGYIARGRYLRELHRRWANATVHIDWLMRDWQSQFRVYGPDPGWLIGQAAGRSDICGRVQSAQWWGPGSPNARPCPYVCLLRSSREVAQQLQAQGFHRGNWRDGATDIDNGLIRVAGLGWPVAELREWIRVLAAEADIWSGPVTIWHPSADLATVQAATDRKVVEISANSLDEGLAKWQAAMPRSAESEGVSNGRQPERAAA